MEFKQTFSREYLQTERVRHNEAVRINAIRQRVDQTQHLVVMSAREGKTQCVIDTHSGGIQCGEYILTIDDLVEGYRAKFPDCKVEYGETWEASPRNPNQMNKKSGIIIDWS